MVGALASADAPGRVGSRLRCDFAGLLLVRRKATLVAPRRLAFSGRVTQKFISRDSPESASGRSNRQPRGRKTRKEIRNNNYRSGWDRTVFHGCFRFCPRPICLQLGQMFFRPAAERVQRLDQGPSESGERVFDFWRNDRMNCPLDEAVTLKAAQRLGQHFLRDPADLALERGVTHRASTRDRRDLAKN